MPSIYLKKSRKPSYPYGMEQNTPVLRSVIFDCDGVLIDSEPLHFNAIRKTLEDEGYTLTDEAYKETYLPMDDKGIFTKFFEESKKPLDKPGLEKMMEAKAKYFDELVREDGVLPFPAVPEFVMALAQRYPLAVASGARRHEVETVLEAAGIRPYFEVIVTADDVERGKPDPESYLKAIQGLNNTGKRPMPITPPECVVIEDSKHGIVSAHTAGLKCIAVATSYPAFELKGADLVVASMAALKVSQIEDLFRPAPMPAPAQNN